MYTLLFAAQGLGDTTGGVIVAAGAKIASHVPEGSVRPQAIRAIQCGGREVVPLRGKTNFCERSSRLGRQSFTATATFLRCRHSSALFFSLKSLDKYPSSQSVRLAFPRFHHTTCLRIDQAPSTYGLCYEIPVAGLQWAVRSQSFVSLGKLGSWGKSGGWVWMLAHLLYVMGGILWSESCIEIKALDPEKSELVLLCPPYPRNPHRLRSPDP